MRTRLLFPLLAAALFLFPATALATFGHVVSSGESLSSVAAADGLSVARLATANGLSPDTQLVAGSVIQIPPQGSVSSAPAGTGSVTAPTTGEESGDSAPDGDEGTASTSGAGGYVVKPGDTLSSIAAAQGLTVSQLAAANGLSPTGVLLAGSTLQFDGSSGARASAPVATPGSTTVGAPSGAQPTSQSVSASDVGSIAAANGVSPSLAEAIGYQESGFNNNLVSSTGATGVMQIEPGTWSYIGQNLTTPLSPSSATDNIRGGVLLLRSLLDQTGGNAQLAAAGYYQGLQSVQRRGMYSDTQRYVNNVMALQQRFGGP